MKHLTCHLDFISPYAYLAFEHLPQALEGLSYSVAYRPVLLGALLKHHGQLGPAEIPAKRSWTYRHVLWLGHAHGIPIRMPATHPYNPLPHLRLALATSAGGDISRYVAETLFREVWRSGGEPGDPARLAALAATLRPQRDAGGEAVKAQLKANTDAAIARGVFGVPAFEVDDRLFWGFDGLAMLRAYLHGEPWFDGPDWDAADQRPSLLLRSKS
ncbi:2-hydroxychromene-2-carboxylate isomerase [Variovorax ginsengisoli]|uniref:2-hydroxychromene-2-carboxylate isomerase n=1 Tax=Variovorax ginsengisoli TaxID=363844 RepID=A0ABT8S079_9BURK|nr:2-hydroxychromene-2-carboxylate isomerase [Variovorax ginsengisoli]MDN8613161.1 2-hydroxychromene-2-carboxylate isomerase [Variovorax ginsengisoli]MDO1532331.1 2-hydroxychromene-2-carboxylate isomerase [Variovorax ginsengisoli]